MSPLSVPGGVAGGLWAVSWLGLRASVGAGLRPLAPLLLDGALAMWCWATVTVLGARPLLGALVVAGGSLGLVLVDRVKRETLREPVVFADRAELLELVRHPGLYLPFAGTWLVLSVAAGLGCLVALLADLEAPLSLPLLLRAGCCLLLGGVYFCLGVPAVLRVLRLVFMGWQPCLEPGADMARFGMLATFVVHATLARAARPSLQDRHRPCRGVPHGAPQGRPIVLLQMESFFDVRRLAMPLRREVLPRYAALTRAAVQHGRLEVPCWGANTVRTEFAVLTGIDPASLGADGFNPYDRFARAPLASLAWRLRAAGYRTICVHPFDTRFYGRRAVLPMLGFDRIIGPEAFARPARGRYVADELVAAQVQQLLEQPGAPCFVFVITMQTHGPWDARADAAAAFTQGGSAALEGYLAELHAADMALGAMCDAVAACEGVLAVYGDHQPSLSQADTALGRGDQATDHLIWDSRDGLVGRQHGEAGGSGRRCDLRAEQLAAAVWRVAGRAAAGRPVVATDARMLCGTP